MVKTFELAIAEVARLPDSDQEHIGRKLLIHVEMLRQLRGKIDEGIQSLEAGKGSSLDVEEFISRKLNDDESGAMC